VAELQQRLGALGFDSGRVDGIFGDNTEAGVLDFQRNAGITADGVVGPVTVRELRRMQARHRRTELVSTVRAREQLRTSPPTLAGRHVALAESGGLAPAVAALASCLAATGARVTALHDPDDSTQAQAANAGEADVLVGLRLDPDATGCATAYYAGYRTESEGGRRLAELIQAHLPEALGVADGGCRGMSIPLLRETKMPAVVVELAHSALVGGGAHQLASAITTALHAWAAAAWE